MKRLKKTLFTLLSLVTFVLAFALAACGGDESKYTISFETFGGTEIAPIEAEAGADIFALLPAEPQRDGYVFGGWYLDEACTGEATQLPTEMLDRDITFYAKWTPAVLARLTLRGEGGLLKATQYSVPVGANLAAFLSDKEPEPNEGLTFAGWYRGTEPLSDAEVMPAAGITLTAKYSAQYTVEVYTEQPDGSYGAAELRTGSAIYGEPFSCEEALDIPEHFSLELGDDGIASSDALGIGEQFKVYLARERYYITYDPNRPDGATVEGTTALQSVIYGAQNVTVSDCGYTAGGTIRYRWIGWSLSPDGEVDFRKGDPLTVEGNTVLYAVWEKGYTDVFGGRDVLYPDSYTAGVLHLERDGVEEKAGTYDAQTDLFSFKDGQTVMLDGRLLPAANQFFYFRDTIEGQYTDMDGTSATLAMNDGGVVVYVDKDGGEHTGKYSIDPQTGYFFFDDDAEPGEDFYYNLYNAVDSDEVVFRRQSTAELGYYYDAEEDVVLYLDGLGGLRYYYSDSNYEYEDMFGQPLYYAIGYYEWRETLGLFLAYTRDIVVTLKQFTFKTETKTVDFSAATREDFKELPKEATIKGSADLDDTTRGNYYAKREDSDNALYLDGYGNATFGEERGTYTLFRWLYAYEEEDSEVVDDYFLVRFTPADNSRIIYFRLDVNYGDYEFDRVISAEEIAAHAGYDFGVHEIRDLFLLNAMTDGFMIIFENGDAEIWSEYTLTTRGNIVYVLYTELISTVVKNGDGLYTFQRTKTTTGQYYENQFDFRIDAQTGKATVVLPEPHVTANVTDDLIVDYTAAKATYKGEDVDYWYTLGYIDFYTFVYAETEGGEVTQHHFWTTSGSHTGFKAADSEDIYDLYMIPGGTEYDIWGRLFFAGPEEGDDVYLAYMLYNGMYRYVGKGEVTKTGDDEHFTLRDRLSDMDQADFEEYKEFDFRRVDQNFIRKETGGLTFSNFTSNGYGAYVFTDNAGNEHYGSITETVGEGDGRLIFFMETSTTEIMILSVNTFARQVVLVTEDAGYWYEMNDNQLISEYKILLLNGRGGAYYYETNALTGETEPAVEGTYTRSPRFVADDGYSSAFPEYTITMNGEMNNYLLATYTVMDNASGQAVTLPLYQAQIAHRVGEFNVRGGGRIESVGYPGVLATYLTPRGMVEEGNMYIGTVGGDVHDHSFTNGADGKYVRFWVLVNGVVPSTDYIFRIGTSGELEPLLMPYGEYALHSLDGLNEEIVLSLDGFGGATYQGTVSGTYAAIAGTSDYQFTASTGNGKYDFRFRLDSISDSDETTYVFEMYATDGALSLQNTADWTTLHLDGYGGAEFINRYGDLIIGSYVLFANGLGAFESDTVDFIFSYTQTAYEAIDHSEYLAAFYADDFSSVIFTDTRVYRNGEQFFYTVEKNSNTVNLYEVEGSHAASTMPLPEDADTYTYNGTTYYAYEGGAITLQDSEFNPEAPVALVFTPEGDTFSVSATFGGYEGYTFNVSYAEGRVHTSLVYRAGTMDSLPETYEITLKYGTKAFTVVPLGDKGTYKQNTGSTVNANNTIELDNRRVGAYSVALNDVDAGNTLVITLNDIKDSLGQPLTFTGTVDKMQEDRSLQYFYQYARMVELTGTDGIKYIFRFILDETNRQFDLCSITVERQIAVEGVGDVTFIHIWQTGTEYSEYREAAPKTLVKVSMHETGIETNIESGLLEEKKAVLIRQRLNTTVGSYDYEAYVFALEFDENGYVTSATKQGNYNYGEAFPQNNVTYHVGFLYDADASEFTVAYIIKFYRNDVSVDAQFVKNEDGSWNVVTKDVTYRINITRSGGGFTLTVSQQN